VGEVAQGKGFYRNKTLRSVLKLQGKFHRPEVSRGGVLNHIEGDKADAECAVYQRRVAKMNKLRIGVLASGRGSNFQSIMDSVDSGYLKAEIAVLITDNPNAYAIERAKKYGIAHLVMKPGEYDSRDIYYGAVARELNARSVGLVVLAGFMRVVGKPLIDAFPNRIMNIHPALLPSFPGLHGQRQANDYGVKISGCTVHLVDEGMDTGPIIIQAAVAVRDDDTEDSLSQRILKFEHKIYPEAIKLFSEGRVEVVGRKVKIKDAALDEKGLVNPPLE
jgi:phosphoribosylglycinamide formyltransferase-1